MCLRSGVCVHPQFLHGVVCPAHPGAGLGRCRFALRTPRPAALFEHGDAVWVLRDVVIERPTDEFGAEQALGLGRSFDCDLQLFWYTRAYSCLRHDCSVDPDS